MTGLRLAGFFNVYGTQTEITRQATNLHIFLGFFFLERLETVLCCETWWKNWQKSMLRAKVMFIDNFGEERR